MVVVYTLADSGMLADGISYTLFLIEVQDMGMEEQ